MDSGQFESQASQAARQPSTAFSSLSLRVLLTSYVPFSRVSTGVDESVPKVVTALTAPKWRLVEARDLASARRICQAAVWVLLSMWARLT